MSLTLDYERLFVSFSEQSCLVEVSQIDICRSACLRREAICLFVRREHAFSLFARAKRCPWSLTRRKWRRAGKEGGKRNAGVERRRAREMSWAERRVVLQTNNLERLNPVKRRTSLPPPLPSFFSTTRPLLPAMT